MPRESQATKQKRMQKILKLFQRYYPDAHCALYHESPLQLLIATILSAQCTDARVNMVTPGLFARFPNADAFAQAKIKDIEEMIRSTGFFRNKAKNIQSCCQDLVNKHQGKVPKDLESLIGLAGVGRKTANVVLGNAYGIASGVVVDTHVGRLSRRMGFVTSKNPDIVERELKDLVPKRHWVNFPHWMITHGREVCKARKPLCETCFLEEYCPKRGVS